MRLIFLKQPERIEDNGLIGIRRQNRAPSILLYFFRQSLQAVCRWNYRKAQVCRLRKLGFVYSVFSLLQIKGHPHKPVRELFQGDGSRIGPVPDLQL